MRGKKSKKRNQAAGIPLAPEERPGQAAPRTPLQARQKVAPETTMATSESPRAMVLVKACCNTLTAFSHGELDWASTGPARTSATRNVAAPRAQLKRPKKLRILVFIEPPRNFKNTPPDNRQC